MTDHASGVRCLTFMAVPAAATPLRLNAPQLPVTRIWGNRRIWGKKRNNLHPNMTFGYVVLNSDASDDN